MESRPKLVVQKTRLQIWINFLALLIIGATTIYLLMNYSKLPNEIPMHFNIYGEVDHYGPKWTIFILWGIGLIIYFLNLKTQSNPHKFNYIVQITDKNAEKQYKLAVEMMSILKLVVIMLIAYLQWAIISSVELNPIVMIVFVVALFVTMVIYMVISRKNR